jgi:hypothetical protein
VRGETRQNLIAISIGLGIAGVFAGFCIRPAVVLPVGATTLENSIGEPGGHGPNGGDRAAQCEEREASFKCDMTISYGSGAEELQGYRVVVDFAGCWQATGPRGQSGPGGCINLTDYLGY